MNPQIKEDWIKALRSGEYVQGKNALHQVTDGDHEFCCLGVLCDLAIKAGVAINKSTEHDSNDNCTYWYDSSMDLLPKSVMEWSGMDTKNGEFQIEDDEEGKYGLPRYFESTLADENDNGKSFDELAELIEELF
jgi:hypothetical protein